MLADTATRRALRRLQRVAAANSQAAAEAPPDQGPAAAGRARQRVLDDLPAFVERLQAQARANGIHVAHVASAQDANRRIISILRSAGSTEILRNHALILDEIEVDRAAAANAIRITRLHAGDHILELAGTKGSHPLWPAAHLPTEAISAILQAKMRVPATVDPDLLASTLRMPLRRTLLRTHTAIIGLNFAVAAEGTLVTLDADGHNANLIVLAQHLICVLSIEQIVADSADLDLLIAAFARGAWGRALPSYITQINRPAPSGGDGPRHVHLILVDNGRSRILAEGFGEALRCIHCGACHNICPVFQQVGGEGYGPAPYSGPIAGVINPILLRPGLAADAAFLCSACAACGPVCPVGIDLPRLLQRQRQRQRVWHRRGEVAFWLWQRLLPYPWLFFPALRLARRLRQGRRRASTT